MLATTPRPVSYTHLDVYKRQAESGGRKTLLKDQTTKLRPLLASVDEPRLLSGNVKKYYYKQRSL